MSHQLPKTSISGVRRGNTIFGPDEIQQAVDNPGTKVYQNNAWIVFEDNTIRSGFDKERATLVCSRSEFRSNPTHWVECSQQATVRVMDGTKVVATISCPRVEE